MKPQEKPACVFIRNLDNPLNSVWYWVFTDDQASEIIHGLNLDKSIKVLKRAEAYPGGKKMSQQGKGIG